MKKQLLALAVITAGVAAVWQLRGDDGATVTDSENPVLDRLWIDKMPTTERETINLFVAVDQDEFGVFQATSMWRGNFELFQFEQRGGGGGLTIKYPQTGERETVRGKVRRCKERDFDYCLELQGNTRGVTRYYSKEEWVIDNVHSGSALQSRIDALLN